LSPPTRIAQVITNLLANAIKYNRAGGKITVTTRAGKNRVSLSVADSGGGISAADLPQVFEDFFAPSNRVPPPAMVWGFPSAKPSSPPTAGRLKFQAWKMAAQLLPSACRRHRNELPLA
jgi:hypothetical protein